jgi:hypothetical protein
MTHRSLKHSTGLLKRDGKLPAKALVIDRSTISRRMNRGKTMTESRMNLQLLTFPEEKALVGWITRLTATGHPATHTFIREMAEEIRKRCVNQINEEMELVSYPPHRNFMGPNFLKHHS